MGFRSRTRKKYKHRDIAAGGPCAEGHGVPGKKWGPPLISRVEQGFPAPSFGSSVLQMTENGVAVAIAQMEVTLRGNCSQGTGTTKDKMNSKSFLFLLTAGSHSSSGHRL